MINLPYHMIITNKESLAHGRKTNALGTTIKIKGSSFTITDYNWQILQITNLLESSYRFGWNVYNMKNTGNTLQDFQKYVTTPTFNDGTLKVTKRDRLINRIGSFKYDQN